MSHPNHSWREQRKAIIATDTSTGNKREWQSLWQAANEVAATMLCHHDTARKEIRKAIRTNVPRYGMRWEWKEQAKDIPMR